MAAPPPGDESARFLAELSARCVPGPASPTASCALTNPSTRQLILSYLSSAAASVAAACVGRATGPHDGPSIVPVLVGTGSLLGLWLRPWLTLALLAFAAFTASAVPLALAGALLLAMVRQDWQLRRSLWHPGPVAPGLHFADTPLNRRRAAFLRASPSVRRERELTRWLWNGDLHTLYPFLAFSQRTPAYSRLWFEAVDGELVALDVALPPAGFDRSRPVALICHGLNGGSGEAYVTDFIEHVSALGWTSVVMIARGLAGTPVRSGRLFHGARTSDLATAARIVSEAAAGAGGAPVVGVGFSMGAIVLANFCGTAGEDNPLACAVGLSGCYDCVANRHFAYGRTYWQPWLTQQLKTNFCIRHAAQLTASGAVDIEHVLSAAVANVTDFDRATVVPLNGFRDVDEYYAAMSLAHGGKLARVAVPLLALHAVDDPIVESATFAHSVHATTSQHGEARNPNCWFRFTRAGGHVGWSLGLRPQRERWAFMHLAVVDFASAVLHVVDEPDGD